jgi:predicted RNase H-like nuclease (RuvC/YqgF family)
MILSEIRIAVAVVSVVIVLGLYAYVQSLRADLATSEANNATLSTAVEQQQRAIDQMQKDVQASRRLSRELDAAVKSQRRDVENLRNRLQARQDSNGDQVTLGALAAQKPLLIERRVNQGTNNAYRCMEIASGASLTEQERNAIKPSEINPECPGLANPRYQP